jgi:hypothetical protein
MKRLVLALLLAAAPLEAQHGPSLADSTVMTAKLYDKLFEDIPLDSATSAKARQVILRAYVDLANIGFVIRPSTWDKVVHLQQDRDSALVELVPKEARALFLERARKTRPRHHFYEWPPEP